MAQVSEHHVNHLTAGFVTIVAGLLILIGVLNHISDNDKG